MPTEMETWWYSHALWYLSRLVGVVGLVGGGVIGCLWYFQERLLFHPTVPIGFPTPDKNPAGLKHPGEQGMEYEDVRIKSSDGVTLHAWFIKQPFGQCKQAATLIFFQGNAGNMGFRLPNLYYLYRFVRANVLAVSYRGYGWSTGTPTEPGVFQDAKAALEYLHGRDDIDTSKVFAFGRSVGGAVAIDLAANYADLISGIIVENTFTDLLDMGELVFPFFRTIRPVIRRVQRLHMDNRRKVQKVNVPFLFISGLQDTLVPPQQMKELYELSCSSEKSFHAVPDGTHNETWQRGGSEYYHTIHRFIEHAGGGQCQHVQSMWKQEGNKKESGTDRIESIKEVKITRLVEKKEGAEKWISDEKVTTKEDKCTLEMFQSDGGKVRLHEGEVKHREEYNNVAALYGSGEGSMQHKVKRTSITVD